MRCFFRTALLASAIAVLGPAALAAPSPAAPCPPGAPHAGDPARRQLRVALNVQNTNIVTTDAATGERLGVPLDLSRALAACAGSVVRFVDYRSVGAILDDATAGTWDIAFIAFDPSRATLAFTAPYMLVENTYLVRAASGVRAVGDVDRDGTRVAVQRRNAPEAYLSRTLRHATLVRAATEEAAFQSLADGRADALASDRNGLLTMSRRLPGARVVDGAYLDVPHAIALSAGTWLSAGYVRAFVSCAVGTGFVRDSIARAGILGVHAAVSDMSSTPCR